jgi:hypothetical protein
MDRRTKLVAGAAAALAVAGGGVAIGATQLGSPTEESVAVVNDAAKQLGVQPSALSNALKKALENRVDAAVAAGRLSKVEGDALKARIESGAVPLFGFGGLRHGPFEHSGDDLAAAASYLGLTETQLRTELDGGKTLAQVAKEKGKSVDGLVNVLYSAEKKELDAAVAAGRLTKAEEQSILSSLKQRITNRVNGTFPKLRGLGPEFHGFHRGLDDLRGFRPFRGPPPAFRSGNA